MKAWLMPRGLIPADYIGGLENILWTRETKKGRSHLAWQLAEIRTGLVMREHGHVDLPTGLN